MRINACIATLALLSMVPVQSFAATDEPTRVPSLDELLGLEEAQDSEDTSGIDQALSPQEAGEAFTQAVGLMSTVADRIGSSSDAGITTQRMQEDILRKLDQIIESAEDNQNSSSGGSSSSSSSNQQQQPNQQQQQSESSSNSSGEPTDGGTPPGSTEAGSNNLQGAAARWGNLPDRLRDALSQGLDEPYSRLYRSLTERYYKQLAEDEE